MYEYTQIMTSCKKFKIWLLLRAMTNEKKKVVLTGATGFLGSALARALAAEESVDLHALTRPSSNLEDVKQLDISWYVGDITQPQSLSHVFDGADWVIHAAGMLGEAGVSDATFRQVNTDGVNNVLAEIERSVRKPRILIVSSFGVLGPFRGQPSDPAPDELTPPAPSNVYERSKAAAELIAKSYIKTGLPVILARPEFVYGPGDMHVLGLFQSIQRRQFFYIGNGRNTCHPTYIDDCIDGLLCCLKLGTPGEIYHIAGPRPVTFRELAETIADELDAPPPRLALPKSLVWLGAAGMESVFTRLGRSVPLSRSGVAFFSESRRVSIAKAQEELGYEPQVDIQEGVARSVAWYRDQGLLPLASFQ
jgi:nucleoside-diphosphate-sugar epimerase